MRRATKNKNIKFPAIRSSLGDNSSGLDQILNGGDSGINGGGSRSSVQGGGSQFVGGPEAPNMKVDLRDLSWDDRERVLRLLFAKINNVQSQVENLNSHSQMGSSVGGMGSIGGGMGGGGMGGGYEDEYNNGGGMGVPQTSMDVDGSDFIRGFQGQPLGWINFNPEERGPCNTVRVVEDGQEPVTELVRAVVVHQTMVLV